MYIYSLERQKKTCEYYYALMCQYKDETSSYSHIDYITYSIGIINMEIRRKIQIGIYQCL